jgi:deazaflavin-dependent oxidoreductase (nitroreductase family)
MPNDFNTPVIDEFRANQGRVGGWFAGARLVLLTTTGARTGAPHTTPLGYLPDGDRILVIGSAGGADRHPQWYRNLVAEPRVTVETGTATYEATAVVLTGGERDTVFARAVADDPGWGDYQARTDRILPVVALTADVSGARGADRFAPGAPREAYVEGIVGVAQRGDEEKAEFFLRHDTFWL